jgi:hypothetical protein
MLNVTNIHRLPGRTVILPPASVEYLERDVARLLGELDFVVVGPPLEGGVSTPRAVADRLARALRGPLRGFQAEVRQAVQLLRAYNPDVQVLVTNADQVRDEIVALCRRLLEGSPNGRA